MHPLNLLLIRFHAAWLQLTAFLYVPVNVRPSHNRFCLVLILSYNRDLSFVIGDCLLSLGTQEATHFLWLGQLC